MITYFYKELTNYSNLTISNLWSWLILVISIVFLSAIFVKSGEKAWKAFIPFYNLYILFKISWNSSKFWVFLGLIIVALLSMIIASFNINDSATIGGIFTVLWIISMAIAFIMNIELIFKLSSSFDKGVIFTIGLLIIPAIFLGILAFDKSTYQKQ